MIKRYYMQDYPENFRDNTETRTIASDFIRHVVGAGGSLKAVNLNKIRKQERQYQKNYMEAFDIFPCYMMKFLCYSCSELCGSQLDALRTPQHLDKEISLRNLQRQHSE